LAVSWGCHRSATVERRRPTAEEGTSADPFSFAASRPSPSLPSSSTSPLPRGDAGPDRCAPAEIENFLLGAGPPPDVEILRRLGLAAYAYTILPADDLLCASLRSDYLSSLVRHQEIK